MKKLFLIVSLLVSLVGYSQYPPNGTKNQWKQGIALGSKNRGDFNSNDSLILTIDKNGKLLWRGNGANATWFTALDSTSAGSGTVTSISTNNGTGINGGTITTSGTLSIDTTNISTRLFRIKGTDSLAGLIALKLSIADTANMLSTYQRLLANYSTTYALSNDVKDSIQARLRIADTASILSGYVLNNRFLDTVSALQSRIQTKQPLLTNPVTGTGVSGRVAYWNGTNTQTGSGKFTWNDASSILSIWAGSTSQQVSIGSINSGTGNRNIQIVGGTPYIFMENSGTANMTIGSGVANLLNYNHIITRGIPFVINYSSTVGSDGSQVARFDNNGTTSSAFIKSGGTSSQFLKADGSVDNNTYATTSSLSNYVDLTTNQTIGGVKTFSNDIVVNSLTVGRGAGNVVNNTVLGNLAFGFNTTGTINTAIGYLSLYNNISGTRNTAIGSSALYYNNTGSYNTAIGVDAGGGLFGQKSGDNNIYLGYRAYSSDTGRSNEIVIGASTTGNGSNTVTIGNSSITNNYFTGNVRGGAFIKSGGTSSQFLKADGSVDGNTYATTSSLGSYAYRSSGLAELSGATFTGNLNSTATIYSNGNITEGSGYQLNAVTIGYSSTSGYGWITAGGASSRTFLALNGGAGNVGIGTTTDDGVNKLQVNGGISGTTASFSGEGLFGGATSDGTNKLIVNGGVKFGTGGTTTITAAGAATFSSLGTGTVYSNSGTLTNTDPSDSTIKNTINPHKYGLAEILKLQPKSFYYNSDSAKSNLKYGFIAQEVEKIMPDMVRKINPSDSTSKLGLESNGIYVTLVNAIKEQQAQIELLKAQLEALKPKQ